MILQALKLTGIGGLRASALTASGSNYLQAILQRSGGGNISSASLRR
jgi:hypothetical protein